MSESNGNSRKPNVEDQDLGLYFLEACRGREMREREKEKEKEEEEEEEEAPRELNTINSSGGFVVVSTDKLSVKYTNVNLHGHDVGVIQANKPSPTKRLIYYFEIHVKDAGVKGQISIGFTSETFKMRRQPGWEANSCGYHGDDGLLYRGHGKGEAFGPTYTSGDVVGAGINYAAQEFFFTKNGQVVGSVYKDLKGPLFPTIAVHSQNEEVHVNFGQKPFTFDLKEFEAQERMKQQLKIEEISVPPNVSYGRIVRSYLLHYGYEDTLNSFDVASKSTVPPIHIAQESGIDEQEITYALNHRKTLRQLIRNGDIDVAFGKLREWYPQIVEDNTSATCFLLHCQKFIELVRVGALEEAVRYGRIELSSFYDFPVFKDLVQDCVALLAYERPLESSVGYLLKDSQREVVADTVNAMILSTNPNMKESKHCLQSYLERLLRQLTACCLERRALNGEQGEAFQLQRLLSSSRRG
ncbi:hypothetical protein LR48_Vigan08g216500 [Vigna angularis]|uniref:B30.2/SPRY domain-containing protein n=1 Tax=Phaseolus angularis TaxID=3914 RepID=A0A0L9V8K5_PHAAN|nr:ran-binding protein M homolog isoform X1 [Vigna angularis]KOM51338.1 hypothetical protein LR48_Vigan08g216500 [Vigna angularis]